MQDTENTETAATDASAPAAEEQTPPAAPLTVEEQIAALRGELATAKEQLALAVETLAAEKERADRATQKAAVAKGALDEKNERIAEKDKAIAERDAKIDELLSAAKTAEQIAAERYAAGAAPKPVEADAGKAADAAALQAMWETVKHAPRQQSAFFGGLTPAQRALFTSGQIR